MIKFFKKIFSLLFKRGVSLHREEKVNIYYIYYIDLSNKNDRL
jgi:hypothetical protein